jgi:hypothetical protein
VLRLRTTVGAIVFVGSLPPDGRYEIASHDGDVRLTLRPAPFRLTARARAVKSEFALAHGEERPGLRRGDYLGGGPSLDLASVSGEVVVDRYRY